MKLKGFCPGNKIPKGILMQGPEALKTGNICFKIILAYERYKNAKQLDIVNEKRPNSYKWIQEIYSKLIFIIRFYVF